MSASTSPASTVDSDAQPHKISIVDLGEHSRGRVRKLRKGQGRLMRKVEETIQALGDGGVVNADGSNVVVVVVREEPRGVFK